MRKHVLTCLPMAWGLAFCSSMSMAQLVEDYHPSQAGCCLEHAARQLAEQLQDWNLSLLRTRSFRAKSDLKPSSGMAFLN